ncbi:hypothetical protein, partial [Roseovarius aestuarii]|uniref:hypothetical protein n=1 Tax=Roseovarius aestuarii TaxID=475083 RepID=UPI001C392A14
MALYALIWLQYQSKTRGRITPVRIYCRLDRFGSSRTSDAMRHLPAAYLSRSFRTAQTCLSPTIQNAAVAARFADICRRREIKCYPNWKSADETAVR